MNPIHCLSPISRITHQMAKSWHQACVLLLVFLYTYLSCAYAGPKQQAIGYSTGVSSPITTATTDLMPKGSWALSHRLDYYRNRPLSDLILIKEPFTESSDAGYFEYLMINYGLGTHVTLGGTLSYTHSTNFRAAAIDEQGEVSELLPLGTISGVADSNIYALGTLFDETEQYPVSMAILAGLNIPTGMVNAGTRQGDLFAAADQPGSGAWGPFAALVFSKKWEKLMISLNLGYTQTTEGTQNTTLASFFEYNAAAVYQLYKNEKKKLSLDGIIELNSWTEAKNVVEGIEDDNSGGGGVFLSPGVRLNLRDTLSFYLSLSTPLLEQYNGRQIRTDYGIISGVDVYF